METYDGVLFPWQDLIKPISIAAANRYIQLSSRTLAYSRFQALILNESFRTWVMPHVVEKIRPRVMGY